MLAITGALHPRSASLLQAAFRSPCTEARAGSPAPPTLALEPVGEAGRVEGLTPGRSQKGQMLGPSRAEHRPQFRVDGNCDGCGGLTLAHGYQAVADMLAAHPHPVGTPLRRVQQQGKRESRPATYRVLSLERRDVVLSPGVEAAGSELGTAHARCRVIDPQSHCDRVAHESAQSD